MRFSNPKKIVDLALSPAMILGCESVDASIDADIANKELRALDKVCYLINGPPAEGTCGSCHRLAPLLPRQWIFGVRNKSASSPVWKQDLPADHSCCLSLLRNLNLLETIAGKGRLRW